VRLFFALPVPAPVKESLTAYLGKLRTPGLGVRWVDPELWHLTLRFLGEVEEKKLHRVTAAATAATAGGGDFPWRCRGLGAFPRLDRPAVLWAGVGPGAEEMARLAAALEARLEGEGFPREGRPFHPHLTLGRAAGTSRGRRGRRPAPVAERVLDLFRAAEERDFGPARAEAVELVASRLTPAGPRYHRVESFPL